MGSKAQAKASSENAKRMKERGEKRTHFRCPVCTKMVPMNHNYRCT